MDGEVIIFSFNFICIIGGCGSGKLIVFESVCFIGGLVDENVMVIDSDVWFDIVLFVYVDEMG